jgi:hypothetical protein
MTRKKIDGGTACFMMDAIKNSALLEEEILALRWQLCYGEGEDRDSRTAKKYCNEILNALRMYEHCSRQSNNNEDEDKDKQPKLEAVK